MTTKRFVLRKTLIGKNTVITFTNKKGETRKYNHDKVYEANKEKLESLPCWEKYGNYTNTNNLPTWARKFEVK
jgi:hypothetical protein|tara:strand:- start:259 stop:477 length:219 start_codon:yes stop_codon:yes gene_type:complete